MKGTYGSTPVNDWGVDLSSLWMGRKAYGESQESDLTNLHKMRSIALLREIKDFRRNERLNFDDISALGLLMIFREDLLRFTPVGRVVRKPGLEDDPFFKKWRRNGSHINRLRGSTRLAIARQKR